MSKEQPKKGSYQRKEERRGPATKQQQYSDNRKRKDK